LASRFVSTPFEGSRLAAGMRLVSEHVDSEDHERHLDGAPLPEAPVLRVLAGPHATAFDSQIFTSASFTVSTRSDRVGVRLEERLFPHSIELTSEPNGFGAIQATPAGELVIIGPDGPTIGGYPKIGYVISADLDVVGQLRPGQKVRFSLVSQEEASDARRKRDADLKRRLALLNLSK
jgi:allophanate hydrolase subunit 2